MPFVDLVARRASPAPVASALLHGEAAGGARQGHRHRGRRGHGDGEGVMHEEEEEEEDVPVTLDDTNEDAEVDYCC